MTLIRGDQPTFAERFMALFGFLQMRPALALAGLAVIAVQGGVILQMYNADHVDDGVRVGKPTLAKEGQMVKINFAPDAKEADIRHLLMSVNGQLGDYFVVVPKGKEAAVAEKLKSDPIVQAVALAPGLPPRE